MKTLFVTIAEFIEKGGTLERGRTIYREENRHFNAKLFHQNDLLENNLLLGYFIIRDESQGTFILENNSLKSFPVTGLTGYVKIQAIPLYK